MRIWTLHPQYLDPQGLVALWRETLLAQKVLAGQTRGYRNHPQLERFRAHEQPGAAIATYLWHVADEASRREYRFDTARILHPRKNLRLQATDGQLAFEWAHLMLKLKLRSPAIARAQRRVEQPSPHPIFHVVAGPVASWERGNG